MHQTKRNKLKRTKKYYFQLKKQTKHMLKYSKTNKRMCSP